MFYIIMFPFMVAVQIIVRVINIKLTNKINKSNNLELEYIKQEIQSFLLEKNIKNVTLDIGAFYCFFRMKNQITIKKKSAYSIHDLFVVFHEAGHCIDCCNKLFLYKFIEVISIVIIIAFLSVPAALVFYVVKETFSVIMFAVYAIALLLTIIKAVALPLIEKRANMIALECLQNNKFVNYDLLKQIKITCVLSISEQVLLYLVFVLIFGGMLYIPTLFM